MQAAHMGIRWTVGNGRKIQFWEDQWLGNTSLAILFWPLYVINEQQGKTIRDIWNGEELQLLSDEMFLSVLCLCGKN